MKPEPGRIRPPRLRAGARVMLVSPGGPSAPERVESAVARCRALGLAPVLGASAGAKRGYLAGTDAQRASDLQQAVDDEAVDAIWAIRGGYGAMRILPMVDLAPLRDRPKAFIGFSDNTALHLALDRLGLVSFHGLHAGADSFPDDTAAGFRRVLFRAEPAGPLPAVSGQTAPETLCAGVAEGELVGGNLALLAAACGTPWSLQARGRILVLEDVGEAVYRIDRMLGQLLLSGALDGVAGIAFGQFTQVPAYRDDLPLRDVLLDLALQLGVPAAVGLPVGHLDHGWTVPLGVAARFEAGGGTLELLEPAVT